MNRLLVAGACLAFAGVAQAEPAPVAADAAAKNVAIPFADNGGISRWRPGGPGVILLQSRGGGWYRGEFRGACPEVRASETVGFSTGPGGVLDRFSKIYVRDRVCRLRSLTRTDDPRKAPRA